MYCYNHTGIQSFLVSDSSLANGTYMANYIGAEYGAESGITATGSIGTINIHFMDHHIVYIALAICPYAGGVRGLVGQSEEHS